MSFNALIVQRRGRPGVNGNTWETSAPPLRFPIVTGLETAQEIPGGYTTGDFTIPARYARYDVEDFREYHQVWVFDGTEPCFNGYTKKAVRQRDGGIRVTCNGMYRALDETEMRVVWSDSSIGDQLAPDCIRGASVTVNSFGNTVLAFPKGTSYAEGDQVAIDYYLFGEPVGPRDGKKIDGFHITIGTGSDFYGNPNLTARVLGLQDPNDSPDTLQGFTAPGERKETSDASFGDNTTPWTNSTGYRVIRVALQCDSATGVLTQDRSLIISDFRVTTRGRSLGLQLERNTTTLVKDLFRGASALDVHQLLQEENTASTGENIIGNIAVSGYQVSGVAFTDWTPPREIIEFFAASDGSKVGMWGPADRHPSGSYVVKSGTAQNYWFRQPPQLVYEDWPRLSDPDYTIRLQRGARWEPDAQDDELQTSTYVAYQTRRGRSASVFADDTSQENYLSEQGWHKAGGWQVDPPVKSRTAQTLGDRYNALHRQPTLSGTITIPRSAMGAIEGRGGERIVKWSRVRPGVCRIVDAKGPQAGRITRCEFDGATGELRLSINSPSSERLDRRLAQLARRADRMRVR